MENTKIKLFRQLLLTILDKLIKLEDVRGIELLNNSKITSY